jgi:hypothetical protein
MEKKITKVDRFNQLKAITEVAENADLVAFIDHEIELLQKKSASKKPTKTQEANEGIKTVILEVLNDEGMTASEVLSASTEFEGMSNQKISALLNQLVKDEKVVKFLDKKKSLFKLA